MKLRKVDWIFVVGALGVVIGVSLLPTPKDRNPAIPRNAEHQAVTTEKACVACHTADAVRPLPARHPKRPDCFRCHARGEPGDGRKTSLAHGQWSASNRPLTIARLPMTGAQRPQKRGTDSARPDGEETRTMVKVLVFGMTLREAMGAHEIELDVAETTTIKKMIDAHPDELGALLPFMLQREVLVAVNKKVGSEDSVVKDGDVVKLTHQSKTSYDGVRDIPT